MRADGAFRVRLGFRVQVRVRRAGPLRCAGGTGVPKRNFRLCSDKLTSGGLKWCPHFPFSAGPPAFKMLQEEEGEEEEGGTGDSGGTDRERQEEAKGEETRSASTPTSTSIIEHCLVDWGSKR